jgi:hypothetical protein
MSKNPTGTKRDTSQAKFTTISCKVSPASIPDVSAGYCHSCGECIGNDQNSDGDAQ